jgi:hypothetical protein
MAYGEERMGGIMKEDEVSIYDSMLEINKLARRIEELSKPFSISREALAQVARDERREETKEKMYAVGDTYAPRDGFYASPFYKLEKAQEVIPVSPPPNAFFIWECKDDGGYVAVARWDEMYGKWVMLDNAAGGVAGVTPCS